MGRNITEYKQETYDDYINRKDYTGLANYLDSFDIDDEELRDNVHNTIIQLHEQARIKNGISNKPNVDKDAIDFAENMTTGNFNGDDFYTKKFNKKLYKIGSTKDREASALEIEFNTEDGFNDFIKKSGLKENELEQNGIQPRNNNGIKSIYFNKSNPLLPTILNSLDNKVNRWYASDIDLMMDVRNNPDKQKEIARKQFTINIKSYDYKGLIDDNVNTGKLFGLRNYISRISRQASDVFNKSLEDPIISTRTTTAILTPFTSAGRRQLDYDLHSGKITRETYNALKDDVEKGDYALLDGVYFTNNDEVYVKSPKSKTAELALETDAKELQNLSVLLHQALDEGRVKMQAALVGNKTGTYITINAKNPKGASKAASEHLSSGEVTGETVIFVPNLLQGECEDAFNRDTQTRAAKEKWNLQTYEYPFYFDDNTSIKYVNFQDPKTKNVQQIPIYKDENGEEIPISDEEVVSKLNRQFIKDEGVYNLYYQRKKSDFYKNNKRENFNNLKDANPDILEYCKAAMDELFPGLNPLSDEYDYELEKLFGEMYNKLKSYKL